MTATIHTLKPAVQLRCDGCGTLADAACGCGVGYMPVKASAAAAKAIAANPSVSNRAIAEKIGIDEGTVRKARSGQVRNSSAPAKRIGKDGKSYPAAPIYSADDVDEDEGVTVETIDAANAAIRRRVFFRCAADTIRKAEQGAGLRDARGLEIDTEVLRELGRVIKAWTDLRAELKHRKEIKQ